jgi:hypothetical protein
MKTSKRRKEKGAQDWRGNPLSRLQSACHWERALAAPKNGIGYRGLHEFESTREVF